MSKKALISLQNRFFDVKTRVGTPLGGLNGDVSPDRVRFSGCFVVNGVSISSLSVLNRVSLHEQDKLRYLFIGLLKNKAYFNEV